MLLFVNRMISEKKDLEVKILKLKKFLDSNDHKLSKGERGLMERQLNVMTEYKWLLEQRIDLYREN